jgi:molybdate transport system ATP-binding protein
MQVGMSELATAAGPLYLPRVDAAPGSRIRVRIMAHDVILSRGRPEGLSAQNILPGTVTRIMAGEGPGVMVHVSVGGSAILARVTRRAAEAMALAPGDHVHAILKALSVARDQVGRAAQD